MLSSAHSYAHNAEPGPGPKSRAAAAEAQAAATTTSPRRMGGRSSRSRRGATLAKAGLVAAAALVNGVAAGPRNNVTSLAGTWSTGSGAVNTGLGFYNPGNTTFNAPTNAGQSYSFTDDGKWEQALYLYESNPGNPGCVQAQLIWQHGTYTIAANNSIILKPYPGDGQQQISSRCAQTSNVVTSYNQQELMQGWEIHLAMHYGVPSYYLQLYEFDGTPKPIMWQRYNPPSMLPTQQLHLEIIGQTAD
ncbi:hypothetical protein BDZ90DRAFT_234801 [Jaminaea rosea]|uniref:Protein ROT1 n=1 Tax=Jaminaea rosea TaxID=1569628 RepID=A0A316UMX1_9BASI|nr:hypothetical protein BDZ90DRAFT_234801 [Jaminaea rosea]PWN24515.1 hypothetical protein BDZ90DRAFT_234801 [Jaminaea rosea]